MVHKVRGVIAKSKGSPVEIAAILVPDPGPSEALVRVKACGVCHTDLHYKEGAINDDSESVINRHYRSRGSGWLLRCSPGGSWP